MEDTNLKEEKSFTFYTDTVAYEYVDIKGEKKHYIAGYISTKDRDLVNDVVTEKALSEMLSQLQTKNIKLDVEHEAWLTENPSIIPIGRIIEAKRDERGLYVKAEINSAHNRFTEVWSSIKNGFLDAFSIAFKPISYAFKVVEGVKTRMLNGVELLNVALTGNPVNPNCKMVEVFTKSLKSLEETEATKMAEELKQKTKEEEDEEEKKKKEEEEKVEKKAIEEKLAYETTLKANVEELKKLKEEIEKSNLEIKSLKEKLEAPILKSVTPKACDEVKQVFKANPLDIIR